MFSLRYSADKNKGKKLGLNKKFHKLFIGAVLIFLICAGAVWHYSQSSADGRVIAQLSSLELSPSLPSSPSSNVEFKAYASAIDNDRLSAPNAVILPVIEKRADLALILESEHKTLGIEVGVQGADFSKEILSLWSRCQRYYLIDPWMHQSDYADGANKDQTIQDSTFKQAKTRLAEFESKTVFMRAFSIDAARSIPDNSVDFVYIDARHDYKAVSEDLEAFWPKLRSKGILAGDDFYNVDRGLPKNDWCLFDDGTRCTHNRGVKAAVEEFARKVQRQVVGTTKEISSGTNWYLRK